MNPMPKRQRNDTNFIISPNDKRQYRYMTLSNHLQILLVNDESATESSASMGIPIGSIDDDNTQGMAHYLEHMLFMGSEKYPNENHYDEVVTKYSGGTNALTSDDHTVYYFACTPDGFETVLDVFAQFFIAPLLKEDAIDREMHAVHSEFVNSETSEGRLIERTVQKFYTFDHPFGKFHIGNLQTLQKPDIREQVVNFYNTHYSSHLMKLVLVSNHTLDTMENWVKSIFVSVPLRDVKYIYDLPNALTNYQYVKYVPIKNSKILKIYWEYRTKNGYEHLDNLLSHIIGDEGKNSLTDYLYKLFYIKSLSSKIARQTRNWAELCITINLTELGFEDVNSVIQICLGYMEKIRSQTYEEFKVVHDDRRKLLLIHFNNLKTIAPSQYALDMAEYWVTVNPPLEQLLSYSYLYPEYNHEMHEYVMNTLNKFRLNQSLILVGSKTYEPIATLSDEYYKIHYCYEPLPNLELTVLNDLHIPLANPYITPNPVIRDDQQMNPTCIERNGVKLWWKRDTSYHVPNVKLSFDITFNDFDGIRDIMLLELLVKCSNRLMNADLYTASCGGYCASMIGGNNIFNISVNGYSEQFVSLLNNIVSQYPLLIPVNCYENIKQEMIINLQNVKYESPFRSITRFYTEKLFKNCYTYTEFIQTLQQITYDDLLSFTSKFLKGSITTYGLLLGNIDEELVANVIDTLKLLTQHTTKYVSYDGIFKENTMKYPDQFGQRFRENLPNEKENNSCCCIAIPLGYLYRNLTFEVLECINFISGTINDHFFNQLRTKEQLGYAVGCHSYDLGKGMKKYTTLIFFVQSPNKFDDNDYLIHRVERFINETRQMIIDIPNEEFKSLTESRIQSLELSKISPNIDTLFARLYNIVMNHYEDYNMIDKQIAITKKITKNDILHIIDTYFGLYRAWYLMLDSPIKKDDDISSDMEECST